MHTVFFHISGPSCFRISIVFFPSKQMHKLDYYLSSQLCSLCLPVRVCMHCCVIRVLCFGCQFIERFIFGILQRGQISAELHWTVSSMTAQVTQIIETFIKQLYRWWANIYIVFSSVTGKCKSCNVGLIIFVEQISRFFTSSCENVSEAWIFQFC